LQLTVKLVKKMTIQAIASTAEEIAGVWPTLEIEIEGIASDLAPKRRDLLLLELL
jgi:hypothetical protein